MSNQVIVLGMHRSGTSILSKVLIGLGVNMGDGDHVGDISNIEGHNEDYAMLKINESILASLNASWDKPPQEEDIKKIDKDIISKYKSYVSGKRGLWGVKEPRLSLFVKQFDEVLSDPKYIYIKRDEDEVAKSLFVRDNMATDYTIELKKHYDSVIEDFLVANKKEYLEITYEELVRYPKETLCKICDFLGFEYDESAISHIKNKDVLLSVKRDKLLSYSKTLLLKSLRNPKKIFRTSNFSILKNVFRRFKELYL